MSLEGKQPIKNGRGQRMGKASRPRVCQDPRCPPFTLFTPLLSTDVQSLLQAARSQLKFSVILVKEPLTLNRLLPISNLQMQVHKRALSKVVIPLFLKCFPSDTGNICFLEPTHVHCPGAATLRVRGTLKWVAGHTIFQF